MSDKIHAVSDNDVEVLLDSLNLLEDIKSEKIICSICQKKVTINDVGCIYPFNNEIKICCDNMICLQKVVEIISPLRSAHTEV